MEVLQVDAGVVATPIFRVDVPVSSQGIRLGSEFSRPEVDLHIECIEVLGPLDLAPRQLLHGGEILQILMIGENINRRSGTFEVVPPDAEGLIDSQEFLIVRIVIPFSRRQGARVESYRVETILELDGVYRTA
jgi:hypothetical protein